MTRSLKLNSDSSYIQKAKHNLHVQISAFIIARTVINTAIRMVYPFLPVFGRSLGVDLLTLSRALTLRSASGVFGPFLASIADTRGRKAGMLLGALFFTVGAGLMTLWPTFPVFVLFLVLTLTGNHVFVPSLQAYLGDWVPYHRRGLVISLTEYGWSLSFLIGVPFIGVLIARSNWWLPFPILTAFGVLIFLGLLVLIPNDPPKNRNQPNLWKKFRSILTYAPAVAGISIAILISCSNELVNLIFGVWLEDTFAVKITALAAASVVIGISELGGEGLVSVFVDRLGKKRAVALGLVLNALAALSLPCISQSLAGALVGLFFLYLTFEFTLVSLIPMMTELFPPARATLLSLNIAGMSIGRALGAQLSPPLYEMGKSGDFLIPGLIIVVCGSAVLNLFAFIVLRTIPKTIGYETSWIVEKQP